MNWYARIDGQEYGPVTVQQLQQWAIESRILATTEVRQGETGTWVQAGQVQGLMPSAVAPAMPQAQSLNTTSTPQITTSGPSVKTTSAGSRYRKTKRRGRNPKTSEANAMWIGGLTVSVVCIVFLVGLVALFSNGSSSNSSNGSSRSESKTAVWVFAQQLCKERLKSPSTASFGGMFSDLQVSDDVVTYSGDGKYQVIAWVDSQNGFGAMIRTRFICEIEETASSLVCTSFVFLE